MRRRTLALALLGLLGLVGRAPQPALGQTSEFKSLVAVAKELSSRIAPKNQSLDLEQFVPADGMEDLLGTWGMFGAERSFQNGVPNTVNAMIWYVTLSRFAVSIADSCDEPQHAFHPRFAGTLKKLCSWPSAEAGSEAVLSQFWWGIMGHSAPEQEYAAWRDFFRSAYAGKPASDTIAAMTLAITMNPYFLLHR
jgi:hypothetical protein